MEVKHTSPLLPLRDIVVFPSMVIPLFVGRDKSITALNEVMKDNKKQMYSCMDVKVLYCSCLNFLMVL